jgi:hypothetical protein
MVRVTLVQRPAFASWWAWLVDRAVLWLLAVALPVALSGLLGPTF